MFPGRRVGRLAGVLLAIAVLLLAGPGLGPTPHAAPLPRAATAPAIAASAPGRAPSPSLYSTLRQEAERGTSVASVDPLTNVWTNLTVPDLPPATAAASMAYDTARGVTILFGGLTWDGGVSNQTWSYLSSSGRWTNLTTADAPPARSSAGLAYDNVSGDLLLFGGSGPEAPGGVFGDCWILPPVGDWAPCPASASVPLARDSPALVSDPAMDGVLLYGGQNGAVNLNDTWLWTAVGGWVELHTTGVQPKALWGMEGTPLPGDQGVLLFGGVYTRTGGDSFYYQTYTLSPSAVWTPINSLPTPPTGMWAGSGMAAMAYLPTMRAIVLFGGAYEYTTDPGVTSASSQTWELPWGGPSPTWTELSIQNVSGEFDMAAAYDPVLGSMLIFGGVPTLQAAVTPLPLLTNFAQFNPSSNWTPALNLSAPPPLALASIAYDSTNGDVLVFGGVDEVNIGATTVNVSDQTWVLSPSGLWTLEAPAVTPGARAGSLLEFLPAPLDEFVLFGGFSTLRGYNDTWTYQIGGPWVNVTSGPAPSTRGAMAASVVPGQAEIIAFGGVQTCGAGLPGLTPSRFVNDTWEYTPAGWTNITRSVAPSARAATFLVPTPTPNIFLLGGGFGPQAPGCSSNVQSLGDTWTFDLTTGAWTDLPFDFNTTAPVFGCGTYDSIEQQDVYVMGIAGIFLLSAGYNNTPWRTNATDVFGLSTWHAGPAPAARAMTACLYDPALGGTFLFGGVGDTRSGGLYTLLGGAWLLRGVAWGISASTSNATAGAPFELDLTARSAWGGVADRNATLELHDTTGTIAPSSVGLVDGRADLNVTISSATPSDVVEACGLGVCVNLSIEVLAPAVRLTLSPLPTVVTAGEKVALSVSVVGPTGAPVQGWSGNASLSLPGSEVSPSTVPLLNGQASATIQFFRAGVDLTLWATAGGLAAQDGPISVEASALASLNLTVPPGSVYEKGSVEATIAGWDLYGNPVGGSIVHLADTLRDLPSVNATLVNGTVSVHFSVGTHAGGDTLTASSGNVSATATLEVLAFPYGPNSTKVESTPFPWDSFGIVIAVFSAAVLLLVVLLWRERSTPKKKKGAGTEKSSSAEKDLTPTTSLLAFLPAEDEKKNQDDESEDED